MPRLAFFVVCSMVVGCQEYEFSAQPEEATTPLPAIEVTPPMLEFSELRSDEYEVQTFTVTNVGDAGLYLNGITMENPDAFQVMNLDEPMGLEVDGSMEIEVAFRPISDMTNFGRAIVLSDDPFSPEVPVDLTGRGLVPELAITPDSYDFGDTFIPCGDEVELTLENVGRDTLVIDEMAYDSGGLLSLNSDLALPMELEPGDTANVVVAMDAETQGIDFGELTVWSNDPRSEVTAVQTGSGAYEASAADSFAIPFEPPVDILFAVDQSCSMDTEAAALATAFGSFIGTINSVTTGWQIGVTTLENGCFNHGVLSSSTAGYQSLFADAVTQGGHHWNTEALLLQSALAVGQTGAGGCNAGFLRPGAMLHVIVVSDEPEQSGTAWSTWVSDLESYVSSPSLLKISAVVDLGSCGAGANGYTEAASATGGEILNICDSAWASQVGVLASASLDGLNEFVLTDSAEPSSIVVEVDGAPYTGTFTYDAANDTVTLDNPGFTGGEQVDIFYDVLSDC